MQWRRTRYKGVIPVTHFLRGGSWVVRWYHTTRCHLCSTKIVILNSILTLYIIKLYTTIANKAIKISCLYSMTQWCQTIKNAIWRISNFNSTYPPTNWCKRPGGGETGRDRNPTIILYS